MLYPKSLQFCFIAAFTSLATGYDQHLKTDQEMADSMTYNGGKDIAKASLPYAQQAMSF